jgi:hypothetical protein
MKIVLQTFNIKCNHCNKIVKCIDKEPDYLPKGWKRLLRHKPNLDGYLYEFAIKELVENPYRDDHICPTCDNIKDVLE